MRCSGQRQEFLGDDILILDYGLGPISGLTVAVGVGE